MDEDDCTHESWECAPNGAASWHTCASGCGFGWSASSPYGKTQQLGKCHLCGMGPSDPNIWITKDSGKREDYASGMRRDTQEGKPRFDLMLVDGIPYEDQFLTRFAALLTRGAEKYGERNWQLADSEEELSRFRASAVRHLMQWACGETDEDHATAVAFNLMAYESIKLKLENE